MPVVMRSLFHIFQGSSKCHENIKQELIRNDYFKWEFKGFIKISFDKQDFKSHIYCLGLIPSFATSAPDDLILCEIYTYLMNEEILKIESMKEELSFVYSPFYVALWMLVSHCVPLISDEHIKLLTN